MFVCKSFYSQFNWCSKSEWMKHCVAYDASVGEDKFTNTVPILIIAGKDDMLVPVSQSIELYQFLNTIRNTSASANTNPEGGNSTSSGSGNTLYHRIIENAGHQMIQEKPSEVIMLIKKFLNNEMEVEVEPMQTVQLGEVDVQMESK